MRLAISPSPVPSESWPGELLEIIFLFLSLAATQPQSRQRGKVHWWFLEQEAL